MIAWAEYVSTMTDSLVLSYNKGEPAIKLLDYVSTQLRMSDKQIFKESNELVACTNDWLNAL